MWRSRRLGTRRWFLVVLGPGELFFSIQRVNDELFFSRGS